MRGELNTADGSKRRPRPRIGVVIPVHNRKSLLLETLEKVGEQTLAPVRLVIADDGSDDGTAEAVETLYHERPPPFSWQVLRLSKRGASAARAAAFERVSDLTYLAFLDSDDHWPADFLARTAGALESKPGAVAASTSRTYRSTSPQGREQPPGGSELCERPLEWIFKNGGGIASCTLLRTDAYLRTSGWKNGLRCMQDTRLFCEIALLGPWLDCPGDPVIYHLGNAPARNEAQNLSLRQGARFRWARAAEAIYRDLAEGIARPTAREWRRALAGRWYRAAREFDRRDHPHRASLCLRRSLYWNNSSPRIWRKLLLSRLRSL